MNPQKFLVWLLSALILTILLTVEACAASPGWLSFYSVGGAGIGEKLAQDADDNVYVGGSVTEKSGSRVGVVKYSPAGQRLWSWYIYDSEAETDQFQSFAVAGNGQVYVAANRFTTNGSIVVFKLDSDGTLLWSKTNEGFAVAVAVDALRNVFVAGWVDPDGGLRDNLLVKYRADGVKLWERQFDGPNPPISAGRDVAVDNAGNVFLVGFGFTICKFDGEGNALWQKGYAGQSAYQVIVDGDGNAYVTGQFYAAGALTVKLNPAGQEVWQSSYDRNGPGRVPTEPCDLALDPQGNLYVATREAGNYELLKLATDGTLLWRRKESGKANVLFSSLAVDGEGQAWLFFTKQVSAKNDYVVLAGFDTDGKRNARKRLTNNRNGRAIASDILLDSEDNPVVTYRALREEIPGWYTSKLSRRNRD